MYESLVGKKQTAVQIAALKRDITMQITNITENTVQYGNTRLVGSELDCMHRLFWKGYNVTTLIEEV